MNRFRVFAVTLLALAFCMSSVAQEKITADEAFRWFPQGPYESLAYTNKIKITSSELYPMFNELLGEGATKQFDERNPLPDSLKEIVESYCVARSVPDNRDDAEPIVTDVVSEDGVRVSSVHRHTDKLMWVFHCAALDPAITESLKAGQLEEVGVKIDKRPVYKLAGGRNEDSVKGWFAYATLTGELLVADDLDTLKLMINVGMGLEYGVLDDVEYREFLPYVRDLGDSWSIEPRRYLRKLEIERWRNRGEEQERISEAEDLLDTEVIYQVQDIVVREEEIALSQLQIFGDSEAAEAEGERIGAGLKKAKESVENVDLGDAEKKLSSKEKKIVKRAVSFASDIVGSIDTVVEGNVIRNTVIFGKKQLSTLKMLMNFAEAMEKKHGDEKEDR